MSDIHHQRSVSSLDELIVRGQESGSGLSANTSSLMGEVDHRDLMSQHIGSLFMNEDYSDVTLIIGNERMPGHRVILASSSEYFRALLFGGLKESHEKEVEIKEVESIESFKLLLYYVYTGRISLPSLKEDLLLEVLGLTHKFGFTHLEEQIGFYLRHNLSIRNVCLLYDASMLYGLTSLAKECSSYIDRNALEVMQHESFYQLSPTALKEMIQRDSFCAQEVEVFKAIQDWIKRNPGEKESIPEILSCVRLPLMSLEELINVVRPCEFVSSEGILDAIQSKIEARDQDIKYRGFMLPEENVACSKHGAQVLAGELKHYLLDGDTRNYDMEKGFTRHHIDENPGTGILIKLGMQCIINHIKLLLWDRDPRSYSYYIEVSMDQRKWTRIIDHQNYLCRSWQNLYFAPRVIKFIKIVGTHNTVNRVFHVVSLECMFTEKSFQVDDTTGLLIPSFNVASISNAACVIEGVSRSRNALINGDWENYDWDTGYTCHQVGSGAIVVQLPQPYFIDSMRLLLWDIDSRHYSYFIEVSVDQQKWHRVQDKTNEPCRSWQLIKFPARPVVFVKIVGTQNTANEVFHCVHFECPAQIPIEEQQQQTEEKKDNSQQNPQNQATGQQQPLFSCVSSSDSSPDSSSDS